MFGVPDATMPRITDAKIEKPWANCGGTGVKRVLVGGGEIGVGVEPEAVEAEDADGVLG